MGEKKITVRTLDSGERCHHHPADEQHPDGKLVLIPGPSPLRERLNAALEGNKAHQQELRVVHQQRIDAKKADQEAKGLPEEKSCV